MFPHVETRVRIELAPPVCQHGPQGVARITTNERAKALALRGRAWALHIRLPVLWLASATFFAWLRAPFDDEWFSIELALRSDSAHFWSALQGDLHPPWLACLDRFLGWLWHTRYSLQGARVLASAAALGLTAAWLAGPLRLPSRLPWLAAFHPIVFMYAGAARWYPFLLLAHALRARALWGGDRASVRRISFIAGSVMGAAASYLDLWFLAHDCAWWLGRGWKEQKTSGRMAAGVTAALAIACAVGLRGLSPLGALHAWPATSGEPSLRALATWAGLGSIGEAGPPWPWLLLGLGVPLAFARSLWLGLRARSSRACYAYVLTCVLSWMVATGFGAWHARYSLWLWFVLTACALTLWRQTPLERALLVLALGYLCVVLGLTLMGRGFYKTDLNALSASECGVLRRAPVAQLVVAPYAGLTEWLQARCGIGAQKVLRLPSVRIVPDEKEQMRPLNAALDTHPREVWLLSVLSHSSLALTDGRVRATLSRSCRPIASQGFGDVPHAALKRALGDSPSSSRFMLERWVCPGSALP